MSGTGSSFACRARTSWRIATAWCAVVAASVLPLAAQSGSNSFHDIAGDTTIVDRLYYSLTRDQQGVEDVSLLTPSIVAYCADPDGCSLTIMATRETSEEFWSRSVRTLYVTPNGIGGGSFSSTAPPSSGGSTTGPRAFSCRPRSPRIRPVISGKRSRCSASSGTISSSTSRPRTTAPRSPAD